MTADATILAVLKTMDLPPYKLDVTKPTTVKWLLVYMRDKNLAHPLYRQTMETLIGLARENKWCKKSELNSYELHLEDDGLNIGAAVFKEAKATAGIGAESTPVTAPTTVTEKSSFRDVADKVLAGINSADTGRVSSATPNESNTPKSGMGTIHLNRPRHARSESKSSPSFSVGLAIASALAHSGAVAQAQDSSRNPLDERPPFKHLIQRGQGNGRNNGGAK